MHAILILFLLLKKWNYFFFFAEHWQWINNNKKFLKHGHYSGSFKKSG